MLRKILKSVKRKEKYTSYEFFRDFFGNFFFMDIDSFKNFF